MATRSTIERIARQIDKLAARREVATHVTLYDNETEVEALEAFGQPAAGSILFSRARQGDRRAECSNGMDLLYRLGPPDVRRLMAQIDGTARGIPTMQNLTSERGSTT